MGPNSFVESVLIEFKPVLYLGNLKQILVKTEKYTCNLVINGFGVFNDIQELGFGLTKKIA